MRASALAVCSYIEEVTGSGATATVNTKPSSTTGWREARESIDHGWLRLDDASTRMLRSDMFGDDGEIGTARAGIDCFPQYLAD